MTHMKGIRLLLQVTLLLLCPSHPLVLAVFGDDLVGLIPAFPASITLRAAVLTNTVPLAWYDANYTLDNPGTEEPFPNFRGFQPSLLREIIKIAKDYDNVTLTFELEEAPPFSYSQQFEKLARDCGLTSNEFTNYEYLSEGNCTQYDLLVGDFYGYPTRAIRATLTPPISQTGGGTLQYTDRKRRDITTLEEAQTIHEPVCLLRESHFDKYALEVYPNLKVIRCSTHDECIRYLKNEQCALVVEDRLQLRYIATLDASLQVTPESFNEIYILWPLSARLDLLTQELIIRWIYQAKMSGILDDLDKEYFSIRTCPLGKAGVNCDRPCSATHGTSNRYGVCICETTRWTGEDCSVEVMEDKNLIPSSLKIVSHVMIAINFLLMAICALWLVWRRDTVQVMVAQPLFLGLVLLGCAISTSTIFPLAAEDEGNLLPGESLTQEDYMNGEYGYGNANLSSCMAIPWLYSVGFCITFGTLFAKIKRVYVLFQASATMQRVTVSARDTFITLGGVLFIDVTILTVWTILDPLQWYRKPTTMDQYGHPLSSEGYCGSDHFMIYASIIAAFHFAIMAVACLLCYVARDIPTQFSEGKYVTMAIISNLQIFVVAVPVLIIVGTDPETSFFVRSVIIWMNDFVVLILIFGNLMWSVHCDRLAAQNRRAMIGSALSTFQERRNRRMTNIDSIGADSLSETKSNWTFQLPVVGGVRRGTMPSQPFYHSKKDSSPKVSGSSGLESCVDQFVDDDKNVMECTVSAEGLKSDTEQGPTNTCTSETSGEGVSEHLVVELPTEATDLRNRRKPSTDSDLVSPPDFS